MKQQSPPQHLSPDAVQRIAIFRALQLGDLLVAVPAFRAIRARFPQAEITLIGLPWAAAFVQRYHCYIDRFVEFGGYPGIKEQPVDSERTHHFIVEQRSYGYDLVVQLHGSGKTSNPFVLELHGEVTAGAYEGTPPAGLTLATVYPHDQHEIYCCLAVAELLGCTEITPRLTFPLFEADHAEASTLLQNLPRSQRPWIGLHPGARPPARRWPIDYFAHLADELVHQFGAHIILTGNSAEQATAQAVIERMHTPAINLAGKTSLGGLGALITQLDLFISNDTGPSHLAHALDQPSITIFGPAHFQRWAPLDQEVHAIVRRPVECSPCSYWTCPIDHRCLRWLTPAMVMHTAQQLLAPGTHDRKDRRLAVVYKSEEHVCKD
ncbi:MAG: glycosyltransferase family 9 protein [Ktedonobacteraceae bacterium]|nr:glycosyltransferase family 9 protein [Ktedonobacteraceae bacterium]